MGHLCGFTIGSAGYPKAWIYQRETGNGASVQLRSRLCFVDSIPPVKDEEEERLVPGQELTLVSHGLCEVHNALLPAMLNSGPCPAIVWVHVLPLPLSVFVLPHRLFHRACSRPLPQLCAIGPHPKSVKLPQNLCLRWVCFPVTHPWSVTSSSTPSKCIVEASF